jgi:hypothetical protein
LDKKTWPTQLLQSDPTVIYAWDSSKLTSSISRTGRATSSGRRSASRWPASRCPRHTRLPDLSAAGLPLDHRDPDDGLIEAALDPDTKDGYLFFYLKNDGSKRQAFAHTYEEHLANIKKYGKP